VRVGNMGDTELSTLKRLDKLWGTISKASLIVLIAMIVLLAICLRVQKNESVNQETKATVTYASSNDTQTVAIFEYIVDDARNMSVYKFKGDYDLAPVCVNADYIITLNEVDEIIKVETLDGKVITDVSNK